LGAHLFLGVGELRSGGHKRHSILSCGMEAIIGAVYLDGGFDAVSSCISEWYAEMVGSLSSAASHKDPKTLLQEYLQAHRLPLPLYKVETVEGKAHNQTFTISCEVQGAEMTFGKGTSRRRAEQAAAEKMLVVLNNE